jgi:hypothetical protein
MNFKLLLFFCAFALLATFANARVSKGRGRGPKSHGRGSGKSNGKKIRLLYL